MPPVVGHELRDLRAVRRLPRRVAVGPHRKWSKGDYGCRFKEDGLQVVPSGGKVYQLSEAGHYGRAVKGDQALKVCEHEQRRGVREPEEYFGVCTKSVGVNKRKNAG